MSFLSGLGRIAGGILGAAGGAAGSFIGGKSGQAIGSAISGIGGAAESAAAARQQYEYQRALQQMSQDFSEKMLGKQQDFAAAQSAIDREWNSEGAKASRLRDAGLNPVFALGNIAAGQVTSQSGGSAPFAGTPSPGSVPSAVGAHLGVDALNQMRMSDLAEADIDNKKTLSHLNRIDAYTKYSRDFADIILKTREAGLIDAKEAHERTQNALDQLNYEFYQEANPYRIEELGLNNAILSVEKSIKALELEYLPARFRSELALVQSEISRNLADAALSKEKGRTEAMLRTKFYQEARRIKQICEREKLSPEQSAQMAQAMLDEAIANAKAAGAQGDTEFWSRVVDVGSTIISGALGITLLGKGAKALRGAKRITGFGK